MDLWKIEKELHAENVVNSAPPSPPFPLPLSFPTPLSHLNP